MTAPAPVSPPRIPSPPPSPRVPGPRPRSRWKLVVSAAGCRLELGPVVIRGAPALAAAAAACRPGLPPGLRERVDAWRRLLDGETIFGVRLADADLDAARLALRVAIPALPRAREDRRLTAGHEAGHVVLDTVLASRPVLAEIGVAPGRGWTGAVWPPPAAAAPPVRNRREIARTLLRAFGGVGGAILAAGSAGLLGGHHELLAAERLAHELAPDHPPPEVMLLALEVVTAILRRHEQVFRRVARNLERHHRLDRRRLDRLLRYVPHDETPVDLLLGLMDSGKLPTSTENVPCSTPSTTCDDCSAPAPQLRQSCAKPRNQFCRSSTKSARRGVKSDRHEPKN